MAAGILFGKQLKTVTEILNCGLRPSICLVPHILIKQGGAPAIHLPLAIVLARKGAQHTPAAVRGPELQNPEHLAAGRALEIVEAEKGVSLLGSDLKIDAPFLLKFRHEGQGVFPALSLAQDMAPSATPAMSGAVRLCDGEGCGGENHGVSWLETFIDEQDAEKGTHKKQGPQRQSVTGLVFYGWSSGLFN